MVDSGNAVADLGAYFWRMADEEGNDQIDTRFSVGVYAFSGAMDDFQDGWRTKSYLAGTNAPVFLDNPDKWETWVPVSAQLALPSNTDYLAVFVAATENVFNDLTGVEFHAHYVDGVTLNIIPAPGAALLLLAPMSLLGCRRRRAG